MSAPPPARPVFPLDLARKFGSMAAMHVALDEAGIGMPCGIVARFTRRTAAEVEAAIAAAAPHFPVLGCRIMRIDGRPSLIPIERWKPRDCATDAVALDFSPDPDGPLWQYALDQQGDYVRLTAMWAHAAADGRSMLHFLETVAAWIEGRTPPIRLPERPRLRTPVSSALWFPHFLFERQLRYVKPDARDLGDRGLSWLTLAPAVAGEILRAARAAGTGAGARLAAAACIAYCEQQRGVRSGRVALNLLASRGDLAAVGGFGFAAGSLLIPVRLDRGAKMAIVAKRIFDRQESMLAQGWDSDLQRFLGQSPARHRLFAAAEARGFDSPSINVSWKGSYPLLGAGGTIRDIACFAAAGVAHVSAHVDANGMSISVASRLDREMREDLLCRIVVLLGGNPAARVLALEDAAEESPMPPPVDAPRDPALSA